MLRSHLGNANSCKLLTTGVQIEGHAHADDNEQQRSRKQHTAQQQRHTPALRLAWPRNTKALYEHLDQVFEEPHHLSNPSSAFSLNLPIPPASCLLLSALSPNYDSQEAPAPAYHFPCLNPGNSSAPPLLHEAIEGVAFLS
jgi:hypothetical protein